MKTPARPSSGSGGTDGLIIRDRDRDQPRDPRSERRARASIARDEWKGRFQWLLKIALIALVILFLDGLRREAGEMKATLASFAGRVGIYLGGKGTAQAPKQNMGLVTEDVVSTASNGNATLVFPDGSGIYVEPNTRFEVRLMDYSRGGVRDRSLLVLSGAAIARVGKFFGLSSQTTICTPTAVAAARGTGFRVSYNPATRQSALTVVDGTVSFRTAGGAVLVKAGQSAFAVGSSPPSISPSLIQVQQVTQAVFQRLGRYDVPPNPVVSFEASMCSLADPVLRRVGFVPGGWDLSGTDAGRRQQCIAAIRRIQQEIAGSASGDSPTMLNPITLEELRLDARDLEMVQRAFAGGMIEGYRKTGNESFVLRVRARDRGHTLYEATDSAVRIVPEQRRG